MKAIVHRRFGAPDVLRLEEVERPVPGKGEVLVRVRAASVNPLDWHLIRGTPRPARLMVRRDSDGAIHPGRDAAGVVEAVGDGVAGFAPGDAVFGACAGAFAEYAVGAESALARKPDGLPFEQAATLPVAGSTALQALRDSGRLRPGQSVLVNGAGGGVGTFAVQIAKAMGAEVTGVCSAGKLELVRSRGADRVLDYAREDPVGGGRSYDLVLDLVGNHSFRAWRRVLAPAGTVVAAGGGRYDGRGFLRWAARLAGGLLLSRLGSGRMAVAVAKLNRADLERLGEMAEAGQLVPAIDRVYPLDRTADAVAEIASGHARGKIVVATAPRG